MSHLDDPFNLGTFESGPFGARFKLCFEPERRKTPVCFDVGARGEHEIYVSRHVEGLPPDDPGMMQRIATGESWAGTMKQLRWLRSQSQPTIRHWIREHGFEPFIDAQFSAPRT